MINNKKCRNYGTLGLVNDKVLRNFKSSLESKKIKSNVNDIGKTSHSNSISIIKNTEVNHCSINNNEKDNKDNYNNVFNQFKKNNNACNNYMTGNDNKKRNKFNTTRKFGRDNHDKIKKSNKFT